MVRGSQVRKAVNKAFRPVESQIRQQEQQLDQRQQEIEQAKQQITEFKRSTGTQSSVRSLDQSSLARRNVATANVNQSLQQIESLQEQINVSRPQIEQAREQIAIQKQQAIDAAFKARGFGVPEGFSTSGGMSTETGAETVAVRFSGDGQIARDFTPLPTQSLREIQAQQSLPIQSIPNPSFDQLRNTSQVNPAPDQTVLQRLRSKFSNEKRDIIDPIADQLRSSPRDLVSGLVGLPDTAGNLGADIVESALEPIGFFKERSIPLQGPPERRFMVGGTSAFDQSQFFVPESQILPGTAPRFGISQRERLRAGPRFIGDLAGRTVLASAGILGPIAFGAEAGDKLSKGDVLGATGSFFFGTAPALTGLTIGIGQRVIPVVRNVGTSVLESQGRFLRNKRGQLLVGQDSDIVIVGGRRFKRRINARGEVELIPEAIDNQRRLMNILESSKPEARELTRDLINKNINDPANMKKLKEFYKRQGKSELFEDLLQQETGVLKGVRFSSSPVKSPTTKIQETLSPRLGGVFDEPGAFRGLGMFERTDEVALPGSPRTLVSQREQQLSGENLFIRSGTEFGLKSNLRSDSTLRSDSLLRDSSALGESQAFRQPERLRDKQRTSIIPRLSFRTAQSSRTNQGTGQVQRPREPTGPRTGKGDLTGRLRILLPTPSKSETFNSAIAKLSSRAKAFDVYVKKKNKWKKVGNDLPLGLALQKGSSVTRKTLAAQFKVVPDKGKKPIGKDVRFVPSQETFRNYEIKSGVQRTLPAGHFIERKNKRISSGGEIKQILKAQRDSPVKKGRPRKNPFNFKK